jgi:coenzyme F420-reducing hydrogenase beta subunit
MIKIIQKEDCCGCHACRAACPSHCIEMVADSEGFLYPQVNEQICTGCGICDQFCPMTSEVSQGKPPIAFAAWNRDETIRAESSSGGVFSTLMEKILDQRGVVIGAAFNSMMILCHQSAQNAVESSKFRGSKYLQSVIGDAYQETQEFLHQGRYVLFSGTPCQIAGLYAYLGHDDHNLLTCDVACHGVPSPKVFAAYKTMMERRHGAKVQKIAFRRKDSGWKRFSLALSFDNAKEYRRVVTDDPFMIGYLRNTYLRPSCHSCRFARLPRVADISLADFWGVEKHHPEWDDDTGTSLVLVQTEKGLNFWGACSNALVMHETDLTVAIRSNPCICGSVPPGNNRADFFIDLEQLPFENLIKKYMLPPPPWRKTIDWARRMARYVLRHLQTGTSMHANSRHDTD